MTMTFLVLLVIPSLKLSDKGLFMEMLLSLLHCLRGEKLNLSYG